MTDSGEVTSEPSLETKTPGGIMPGGYSILFVKNEYGLNQKFGQC